MGALTPNLRAFSANGQFIPGGRVIFGNENQRPDPDNPATLKQIFTNVERTIPAQNPQPLDSDAKYEQGSSIGVLYGYGTYSIVVQKPIGGGLFEDVFYDPAYVVVSNLTAQEAAEAAEAAAEAAAGDAAERAEEQERLATEAAEAAENSASTAAIYESQAEASSIAAAGYEESALASSIAAAGHESSSQQSSVAAAQWADVAEDAVPYTPRGNFSTGTAYVVKDIYIANSGIYNGNAMLVLESHTSTSIDADVAAGKVTVLQRMFDGFTYQKDNVSDAKAVDALPGSLIQTQGYYSPNDGGGGLYRVVAPATGTVDGGAYHTMDNGNQLSLITTRRVNLKQFGARGDAATNETNDDTAAIDNWLSYVANQKPNNVQLINNERPLLRISDAPTLYVPEGTYNYSGAGFDLIPFNSVFQFVGDSPESSTIRILSDVHLLRETDSSDTMRYLSTYNIAFQGGRGLFLSTKTNVAATQYGFSFHKTKFYGYTSCAVGSYRLNAARWWVSENTFSGGGIGTPVGLMFPPEAGMLDVHGNIFSDNKYHIIGGEQNVGRFTQSRIGPNNSLFSANRIDRVADILLVPSETDNVNGWGLEIAGNRFSNENASGDDYTVLIAELDRSLPPHVFQHLSTVSDGTMRGVRVVNNNMHRVGRIVPETSKGIIYSYAYKTGGIFISENNTRSIPWYLEFDASVSGEQIDEGKNHLNRFYPLKFGPSFGEPSPKKGCNVDGGGLLINWDTGYYGRGRGLDYADNGDSDIAKLLPHNSADGGLTGSGVTKTVVNDIDGTQKAVELKYDSDSSGAFILSAGIVRSNIIAGKQAFVEFDIKSGTANSLESIYVDFVVGTANTRELVTVTDEWQRIRFPVSWAGDYSSSGTLEIRLICENNYSETTNTVQVGRRSFYQSNGPIPYAKQEI